MTPSRKGFNPIKLPFAIKSSNRTFASWANEVVTAIQQLRDRIPQANVSRTGTASVSRPPLWTTLSQVPESDPAEYQVSVTLGYLTYQNAGASEEDQGVTGYIVPKIDGVALDDESVQPLELPAVVSYVYLRVKTDSDGVPDFAIEGGPVTIEAFDAEQDSVHHVRENPLTTAVDGDYFFLICETEEIPDSSPAAPRIKRRLTGNRYLPNQLVELENIADGEVDDNLHELYAGYQPGPDDKHQLRSIKQVPVDGVSARLIAEKEDPQLDSVKVKIIKKGNDSSVPWTIEDEAEAAVIELQGSDDTYTDPFGGSIEFDKGLASLVTNSGIIGKNLNFYIYTLEYDNSGAISGTPYLAQTLYWRGGIYVGTVDPEDEPDPLDEASATLLVNAA